MNPMSNNRRPRKYPARRTFGNQRDRGGGAPSVSSVRRRGVIGFAIGSSTVQSMAQTGLTSETYRISTCWVRFEQIRAQYVEDVSDEQIIEVAVNGMLTRSIRTPPT